MLWILSSTTPHTKAQQHNQIPHLNTRYIGIFPLKFGSSQYGSAKIIFLLVSFYVVATQCMVKRPLKVWMKHFRWIVQVWFKILRYWDLNKFRKLPKADKLLLRGNAEIHTSQSQFFVNLPWICPKIQWSTQYKNEWKERKNLQE